MSARGIRVCTGEKIVVVGAGLAGLTAAYRIEQLTGQPVEMFEARERVGGRVFTAHMGSSYAELGGRFITDGGEAKNIKTLISELGLEIDAFQPMLSERKCYFQGEASLYYDLFKDCPEPDEKNFAALQNLALSAKNLAELLDTFFAGHEKARHLVEVRMRCYQGNDSKDLSLFYLNDFWEVYTYFHKIIRKEIENIFSYETVKGGAAFCPKGSQPR